jgi:WD40-like Beta Propeller Repeat
MRCAWLLAVLTLLTVALAPAGTARADVFGEIDLASDGFLLEGEHDGAPQQALYAHDSAISGNGQYVVFDGYFGGRAGVWRRELTPEGGVGPVEPVAVGGELPGTESCALGEPCDARLPSVSESGQYVSFTTRARLTPQNSASEAPNVFVRNMAISASGQQGCEEKALHPSQPCPYTLVSAVNGKAEALTYEGPSEYGSIASGRSAMSANGQKVAFVTTAVSNLAACEPGAAVESACQESSSEVPVLSTPALQVAVRDLATDETQLVSVEYDRETSEPIPDKSVTAVEGSTTYGAVYSALGEAPPFPNPGFDRRAYNLAPAIGASISADGTTVAWMATDVYKQARMLLDETSPRYAEPLWRRIADGPMAPIRRVTGGSEPEDPACIASGETSLSFGSSSDPCQGPFAVEPTSGVWAGSVGDVVPQLSANGDTVAFLATAQLISLGVDFGRSAETTADDVYIANMQEGLTRNEALQPLTEVASGEVKEIAPDGAILDLAISPDGSQVAFTTQRTEFPLDSFADVSQTLAVPGLAELFDIDLGDDTLTRVSRGYEGGPSEHPHPEVIAGKEDQYGTTDGALSPSFSDNGDALAFSSTASNLVFGDGNTPPLTSEAPTGSADGGDVFVVPREVFSPEPAETYVSSPPPGPSLTPEWRLRVTALSLANGSVRLYVEVPGTGTLSASDRSAVVVRKVSHAARATAREPSTAKRASVRAVVTDRNVASAKATVGALVGVGGLAQLTLTLRPSYRALAAKRGGLDGAVTVSFAAPGHPTLRQSIAVSFLSKAKKIPRSKQASSEKKIKR